MSILSMAAVCANGSMGCLTIVLGAEQAQLLAAEADEDQGAFSGAWGYSRSSPLGVPK